MRMDKNNTTERVAILDAGSQFGKVIDRRVRELMVDCSILDLNTPAAELIKQGYKAIIISGGPRSVYNSDGEYDPEIFTCGLPMLGICYGLQLIASSLGGAVDHKDIREDGQFEVTVDTSSPLFAGLDEKQVVLLTHSDFVTTPPPGFKVISRGADVIAALGNVERRIYGTQFHIEVDLTENGRQMLSNFLFGISKLSGSFTLDSRLDTCVAYIRSTVGSQKVLMLLSGGVDSTVCAALLHRALPAEQTIFIHMDHGFMRLNESKQVVESLAAIGVRVEVINCDEQFATATTTWEDGAGVKHKTGQLRDTIAPEEKRRIIGDTFMVVSSEAISRLKLDRATVLLGQGTLRPDLIESASRMASSHADAIKTHHNDTYLVRLLRDAGRVVEPLTDFHKDEVRQLGRDLGLPSPLVDRHPFPGPGLAIRIICADAPHRLETFSWAEQLLKDYFSSTATSADTARLAAMNLVPYLLPIRSVGLQGDCRSYSHPLAVFSSGEQEADWPALMSLATNVPRLAKNTVNRVLFGFGPPPAAPQLTPTLLRPAELDLLRECDALAHGVVRKHNSMAALAQMPVVLIPLDFSGGSGGRAIVVRTFITHDFMTGLPALPGKNITLECLAEMVTVLRAVPGVTAVLYDLTSKPPATTEWE